MLFWRLLVAILLFWLALLALGFAEAVQSESLYERQQTDPRAKLFFLCTDHLQRDIELGLKPDMTDQEALNICSERTESVIQSMQQNGLELPGYDGGFGF